MSKVSDYTEALRRAADLYEKLPDYYKELLIVKNIVPSVNSLRHAARVLEVNHTKITNAILEDSEPIKDDGSFEWRDAPLDANIPAVGSLWYDRNGNWEIEVTNVRSHEGMIVVEWIAGSIELDNFLFEFYQPPKYGSVWRNKHNGYQVMVTGHEVDDQQLTTIYTLNDVFTTDDFYDFYEVYEEVTPEVSVNVVSKAPSGIPEVGSYWTHKETGRITKVTDLIWDAYGRPIIFEETSYADGTFTHTLDDFRQKFKPNGA
jgi:hypothetical protein